MYHRGAVVVVFLSPGCAKQSFARHVFGKQLCCCRVAMHQVTSGQGCHTSPVVPVT
jgi:hypothetical protein